MEIVLYAPRGQLRPKWRQIPILGKRISRQRQQSFCFRDVFLRRLQSVLILLKHESFQPVSFKQLKRLLRQFLFYLRVISKQLVTNLKSAGLLSCSMLSS